MSRHLPMLANRIKTGGKQIIELFDSLKLNLQEAQGIVACIVDMEYLPKGGVDGDEENDSDDTDDDDDDEEENTNPSVQYLEDFFNSYKAYTKGRKREHGMKKLVKRVRARNALKEKVSEQSKAKRSGAKRSEAKQSEAKRSSLDED
jgi:hypothetical protein